MGSKLSRAITTATIALFVARAAFVVYLTQHRPRTPDLAGGYSISYSGNRGIRIYVSFTEQLLLLVSLAIVAAGFLATIAFVYSYRIRKSNR